MVIAIVMVPLLVSCNSKDMGAVEVGVNNLTFSVEALVVNDGTPGNSFHGSVSLPKDIPNFESYSMYIGSVSEVTVNSVKFVAESSDGTQIMNTQVFFNQLQKTWTIGQYQFGEVNQGNDELRAIYEDVLKGIFAGNTVDIAINGKTNAPLGRIVKLTFAIDGLILTNFWK
ncbi:hypothetical protein FACS1894182_00970 [Bacteroidia bacterium]|nr:hypothetical protein FACS1894182_00970 [Bacteroidia bacterium]